MCWMLIYQLSIAKFKRCLLNILEWVVKNDQPELKLETIEQSKVLHQLVHIRFT